MALTDAQLITLKADIAANADTNTIPMGVAGDTKIRDLYNAVTTLDVWQPSHGVTPSPTSTSRSRVSSTASRR